MINVTTQYYNNNGLILWKCRPDNPKISSTRMPRSKKMHRNFITNRENTAIVRKFYKIIAEKLTYFRQNFPWPNISQNTAF